MPAIEHKAMLWELVQPASGIIQYSQHVEGSGADFFAAVDKLTLRAWCRSAATALSQRRIRRWVKTKCWDVDDLDLIGVTREAGKQTEGLFAKDGGMSARRHRHQPRHQGTLRDLTEQPARVPTAIADASVEWVKPGITARVRHLGGEAKLRHASVEDFREE
jgi:bifunctional non-homologous end joining protein LigD